MFNLGSLQLAKRCELTPVVVLIHSFEPAHVIVGMGDYVDVDFGVIFIFSRET